MITWSVQFYNKIQSETHIELVDVRTFQEAAGWAFRRRFMFAAPYSWEIESIIKK